jgi:hypothetical protein
VTPIVKRKKNMHVGFTKTFRNRMFFVIFMPLFYIVDIDGRFLICDQISLAIHRNTEGFGGVNRLGGGTGTSACKVLVGVHSVDYNAFHYYAVISLLRSHFIITQSFHYYAVISLLRSHFIITQCIMGKNSFFGGDFV